jgi:Protein of unknown function (DUF2934)
LPTTKEVAVIETKELSKEEISLRAYELYLERGGEPGKDVEDWAKAEKELRAEPIVKPAKTMPHSQANTN